MNSGRIAIVSNRLPLTITAKPNNNHGWDIKPSVGGLVTALGPVLRDRGGLWIGWPGTSEHPEIDKLLTDLGSEWGYTLKPVILNPDEISQYYYGFANEILWPLLHDLQSRCNFESSYWSTYKSVNDKFAQIIAESVGKDDYIWVHDYHLMLIAKRLRDLGVGNQVGFFLHTPFPPMDIFSKLPWRSQIISALLYYDSIGFQTRRDRNNFIHCVEAMTRKIFANGRKQISSIATAPWGTKAVICPISIDFQEFGKLASDSVVVELSSGLRQEMGVSQILLGVDRLDYTKGIPQRLRAYKYALEHFRDLRGNVSLIQIVVPSREDIAEYRQLKSEIEGLVSEINGGYSNPGWVPIHYIYRSYQRPELVAFYKAADMALVTPLKDGMNLIAKEYCAANTSNDGVLILSEFAGAANQLRSDALLVNPYDVEGIAHAIYKAYCMPPDERRSRMRRLRKNVAKRDIYWWVNYFVSASSA